MAQKFVPQLSTQSSSDESVVANEIELLTNIYDQNELIVKECEGGVMLTVHITPRTADDIDQQFVYVIINMELSKEYPLIAPVTKITKSRGLSEAHITSIINDVQLMAVERLGEPMLFDLLEHVRDCLTDQNKPCGSCSICLCMFEEGDQFTKTECYHYFHVICFARYVHYLECDDDDSVDGNQGQQTQTENRLPPNCVRCPVCRVSLTDDSSCFHAIKDVTNNRDVTNISNSDDQGIVYCPSEADIQRMKEWECLMEKQRSQGGIIDHSKDPHLVDWDWVPPSLQPTITVTTTNTTPVASMTTTSTPAKAPPPSSHMQSNKHDNYNTHYHHKKTRHKHH